VPGGKDCPDSSPAKERRDQIPVERRKKEIEKATKLTLAWWSKQTGVPYSVMFHSSKSDLNLQIADYLNWAVFRKWERNDQRSYDLVSKYVTSEYETFKRGYPFGRAPWALVIRAEPFSISRANECTQRLRHKIRYRKTVVNGLDPLI
jgi:hypothetical protein